MIKTHLLTVEGNLATIKGPIHIIKGMYMYI